jgi:hypothetical protein
MKLFARNISLSLFLLISVHLPVSSQNIAINEVMASNAMTIADEDGDFEDWIEIFNFGDVPVDLEGYGLSDDYGNPFRWIFPAVIIEPGEFHLIWASGKDRRDPEHPLHSNFSISSDGEELLLTRPDGERIDEIPPTLIPEDTSYGRYPDGTGEWVYYKQPTPARTNASAYFKGILGKVTLSHYPGFYFDNFWLELSNPEPETTIYYTLDGSEPDTASLLFEGPILITDRSDEDNQHSMIPTNFISGGRGWVEPAGKIAKATVIRAISFKDGYMKGPVVSATYFVFPEGRSRYSMDVISISTNHEFLFSDSIGIYVPGNSYVEGRGNTGNYIQRGSQWERPASFEFFGDDITFPQDIGIRIHGGFTRRFPQKTFRLYARSDYGENRFNYQIFPELPYTSYNRLLLRNSGNDNGITMFRDAAAQSLVRHFDVDVQAYRPTVVFINGEYWGIKNLRERYDRHYLERVYEIDPDNIDLLTYENTIIEGSNEHYNAMIRYIDKNDLSDNDLFDEVGKMMDINNFLDYYSAQIYYANDDWPGNNTDFWRLRTEYDPDAPKGHDGRWRWLLYDVDVSLGLRTEYTFNMIHKLTGYIRWWNLIIRNLLDNENFQYSFINRIADHLNTAFLPSRVHYVLDSLKSRIEPEINEHIHRWGKPSSKFLWESNVQVMYTNASNRPAHVRKHVMDHFKIEGLVNLTLKTDHPEHGYIRVNSIDIHPSTPGVPVDTYPWTGIYFHGIPIEVEAVPNEGYAFSHWVGAENQMDRVLNTTPGGDISLKAYFVKEEVPEVISYWFFGTNLPNDVPLDTIMPVFSKAGSPFLEFQSAFEGYPIDSNHENWRKASLERRNAPTEINYHQKAIDDIPFEESGMRGIQVKQPLEHQGRRSELIFHVPSTGFREPVFRFAAMDEGAAEGLVIDFSVTGGQELWTSSGPGNTMVDLSDSYQLYEIDLSTVEEAENNPDLKIRIRFEGADMTTDEGNRVTFNNFSLHGVPLNLNFFSKSTGELNDLSTWGAVFDGSGEQPPSFGLHSAKYHVRNRETAELNSPWEVTGIESSVIAGDGINEIVFEVNAAMEARVDLMPDATLHLSHSLIPEPGDLRDGSTVIFAGLAATIPYHSYYNLTIDGTDPFFEGNGTVSIRGNLTLEGNVTMPAARGSNLYNLEFTGSHDQLISGNGNVVRGYNITFDKAGGMVSFPAGNSETPGTGETTNGGTSANGATILSSDNQLIMNMTGESMFGDSGITIYAGNSVNIGGNTGSYNFTGTLVLAGIEEGIVNGAGSGNNFNIRDSNQGNANPVAELNNIIIRAQNSDGEFRFRDGTTNRITVKGNLTIESAAAGRITFYENSLHIGGDLVIEDGFPGDVNPIRTLVFDGSQLQKIAAGQIVHTGNLTISNTANLNIQGVVQVADNLHFEAGKILTGENGLVKLDTEGYASGYDIEKFVDGPVGIYCNNIEQQQIVFPTGKGSLFNPLTLEVSHHNDNMVLYIAELHTGAPPQLELAAGLFDVFDGFHFSLYIPSDHHVNTAFVSMQHDPFSSADPDIWRIIKSEDGRWSNIGGTMSENTISSTISFSSPGYFALAKLAREINVRASAAIGGKIEPEGVFTLYQGSDKTFNIRASQDRHIKDIFIDGVPLEDAPGNFAYTYTFNGIIDSKTIHAEFAPNNYQEVDVFPNPATEGLWVRFRQNIEYVAVISLITMSGQTLAEKTLSPGGNTSGFISLKGTQPGTYILKIEYGHHIINRKILVL